MSVVPDRKTEEEEEEIHTTRSTRQEIIGAKRSGEYYMRVMPMPPTIGGGVEATSRALA